MTLRVIGRRLSPHPGPLPEERGALGSRGFKRCSRLPKSMSKMRPNRGMAWIHNDGNGSDSCGQEGPPFEQPIIVVIAFPGEFG